MRWRIDIVQKLPRYSLEASLSETSCRLIAYVCFNPQNLEHDLTSKVR